MNEADGKFGAQLRARRRSSGLSQEELAERSGLNARTIRNLERGRARWPYRDTLHRLADALELRDRARAEFLAAPGRRPASPVIPPPPDDAAPPRQLPAGIRHFTGRQAELNLLTAMLDDPGLGDPGLGDPGLDDPGLDDPGWGEPGSLDEPRGSVPIAAISGTAGAGKSALAVHWAHQHADRFPDGQLYADLRGFDPAGPPLNAATVLCRFLNALAVPPARIPADLDAQAALYRSMLASRRMLIVLDNARDAHQARPLLPGAAGCMILITSRSQLTDLIALEGAALITVGPFSPAEAHDLLARRLGPGRVAAEPPATSELINLCGRLPLTLNIAAARAAASPALPLSTLAARLHDTHQRLDLLSAGTGRADVRAVFSWSYHALSTPAARLFRLLAVHPGPDFSLPAAASLAALDPIETRRVLDELTGVHLVTEPAPGRYALPDLLRAHAVEQPAARGDSREHREALRRVLDHYLHTSHVAAALHPTLCTPPRLALTRPAPGVTQENLTTPADAMAWLAAEHQVLIAAATQAAGTFDAHALRLPLLLRPYLCRTGRWHASLATGLLALAAADRLGDLDGQGQAHCYLGSTYRYLGDLAESESHLRQALTLYRQTDHHLGLGVTHTELQVLRHHQRRNSAALQHARQALIQYRIAGCAPGEANVLNNIGWSHIVLGDPATGLPTLKKATAMSREIGDRLGLACTLDSVGYAYHRLGEPASAITRYTDAEALSGEVDVRPLQAEILDHLGDAHHAVADPRAARRAWHQAMDIYTGLDHHDVTALRTKIATA